MKLYWSTKSRASRAVWMLEEAGVDYEIEVVDIRAENRDDDRAFRLASPMGKVPALEDGDVRLAESAAICIYVADRYAPGRLAPAIDVAARGPYLFWTMYTPAVVEPALAEKFSGTETNPRSHAWGDFDLMLDALEKGIGDKPWVLGEEFTAADVMLGSSVIFMQLFGVLPAVPRLAAYADRCMARPAYRKAAALDED